MKGNLVGIDYASVKADELEMTREPRKSTIVITHKPTGTVATKPVVPGSLSEARFRRPSNLKDKTMKSNDMVGYIEGTEESDTNFYKILEGENAVNEYLVALAADPAALQAAFEGTPKTSKPPADKKVEDSATIIEEAVTVSDPAPTTPVSESDMDDIDALLDGLGDDT